jgi:hypothetical protein
MQEVELFGINKANSLKLFVYLQKYGKSAYADNGDGAAIEVRKTMYYIFYAMKGYVVTIEVDNAQEFMKGARELGASVRINRKKAVAKILKTLSETKSDI